MTARRVVGRSTPAAETSLPTSVFRMVDLPTPVDPRGRRRRGGVVGDSRQEVRPHLGGHPDREVLLPMGVLDLEGEGEGGHLSMDVVEQVQQ
jgi:hypothetical protein